MVTLLAALLAANAVDIDIVPAGWVVVYCSASRRCPLPGVGLRTKRLCAGTVTQDAPNIASRGALNEAAARTGSRGWIFFAVATKGTGKTSRPRQPSFLSVPYYPNLSCLTVHTPTHLPTYLRHLPL